MKSVVGERFIKTLKNKIYDKYMTLIFKILYIDKLDDIVNEYNNTYHRNIKINVKSSTYIDFGVENNKRYLKFEVN